MNNPEIGKRVKKSKGFQFPGTIVSVFQTTQGATRVVVEAEYEDFKGMLHIYNPEQLEERGPVCQLEQIWTAKTERPMPAVLEPFPENMGHNYSEVTKTDP